MKTLIYMQSLNCAQCIRCQSIQVQPERNVKYVIQFSSNFGCQNSKSCKYVRLQAEKQLLGITHQAERS